jgi:hypothetical protein
MSTQSTSKTSTNHPATSIFPRPSSSSASSSTSSSIDDALIQLTQQQQKQKLPHMNKFFNDEPISIFHFTGQSSTNTIDKQQQAVHDNINFLASMASSSTPVTSESAWQQANRLHSTVGTSLDSTQHLQRQMPSMTHRKRQGQHSIVSSQVSSSSSSSSSSKMHATNIYELMQNLNELCYKGFDELNALIQEQRWVSDTSQC